jgi:hypothetical protein
MPVAATNPPSDVFRPPSETWQPALARRPRRRHWLRIFVLLGIFTVLAAAGGVGVYALVRVLRENPKNTDPGKAPFDLPYASYSVPDLPWRRDERTATSLYANYALRRDDNTAWMALATKDYKDHNPREAKLVEEAIRELKRYFHDGELEREPKEDVQVAGQTAKKFLFQGQLKSDIFSGECVTFASKGYGYWIFTWRAGTMDELEEDESLRKEFAELWQGLALKDRPAWRGDRIITRAMLTGKKGDYTLYYDAEGLWEKRRAEDYDVAGDLALLANDRESKDADKRAEVLVMRLPLPEDGNLAEAARLKLEEMQTKEYEGTTMEPLSKDKAPNRGRIGDTPGQVLRYKVINTKERQRFVILGIVKRPLEYLLIKCECDWKHRDLWETDFLQLLSTFHLKQ